MTDPAFQNHPRTAPLVERPPDLEELFAHTVATGWKPRRPASWREIAHLQRSIVRGDCVSPLLQDGDTIYTDPRMPAQPGDLVTFHLSRRGAAVQNSGLPPGQLPCKAGARWGKLLAESHGFLMLLDRHGTSACATLLACESPDDVPILHPIRNIRRGGRLLFAATLALAGCTPSAPAPTARIHQCGNPFDSASVACSQMAFDAATEIYSNAMPGPTTTGTQVGVFSATTVAVPASITAHTAIATLTGDFWKSNAGAGEDVWIERDLHGATTGGVASEVRFLGATASPGERVTLQYEFANPAGTAYDYTLQFNTNSPSNTITAENVRLQIELVKR